MTISQAQADAYLLSDLAKFSSCVNSYITARLNPNQVGALISFTSSVGCRSLQHSGIYYDLNAGLDPNTVVSEEFPRYVSRRGQVLPGLVRRRAAEVAFFTS